MIVRRSATRMWLLAIAAIPLLVISIDVLTRRRLTNWLREIVFRPEDTQIFETRDVIYAWAIMVFAIVLVLWGLKELFYPTKVIECTDEGLAVRLRGPFRPPDVVPWADVIDVVGSELQDEGDSLPLLKVELTGRDGLPEHPWGARWVGRSSLGILAQDWAESPPQVAAAIAEYAVGAAQREAKQRTARLWEGEDP